MNLKLLVGSALFCLLQACSLPPVKERHDMAMLLDAEILETRLGKAISQHPEAQSGLSGVHTLEQAKDAFAARVFLARLAEKTLDVQYYIWRKDITGTLLLHELHQAADRGVRVRLLLDDNGISGMDDWLALLDRHPNIDVRLFNPFVLRRARALGFITEFSRVNRRMHNKSFTADQSITIAGGRNVGDEYFAATDGTLFADLDVMVAGSGAREVTEDFDRYWSSDSAWPVDELFKQRAKTPSLAQEAEALLAQPQTAEYAAAVQDADFIQQLLAGTLSMKWVDARLVSDDPAKGLGKADQSQLMIHSLFSLIGKPEQQLDLVSPYFVPTRAGVEAFSALAQEGIKVRILTNALEATDVAAVHSGYAKRRKALLQSGVQLYEMKHNPAAPEEGRSGLFGSSGSSLHAKTFAVDNTRIFIGSFNFDPRSAKLNTEMGFVIDSEALALTMERAFTDQLPALAYEVKLDKKGRVYWLENNEGDDIIHQQEPGTTWLKRAAVTFMSWLPIEWLL